MAFWGVEVKPDKPYTHSSCKTSGRLRLSQATLGFGASNKKSLVQCNVGNKTPVLLCCLLPDKSEYCHLELEFDEEDKVVFSVIGPRSVHLTGYYLSSHHRHRGFDDSSESYGEDIGHSDTEKSNDCSDEDDYEDSFINDGDVEVSPPSPGFTSEETEEDIMDDEKSNRKKDCPRRRRLWKYQISESEDDGSISLKGVCNGDVAVKLLESEDEDKIPISSLIRCGETSEEQKLAKDEVDIHTGNHSNGKADKSDPKNAVIDADPKNAVVDADPKNAVVDADPKREPDIEHTSVPAATLEDLQQNEEELKVGKKKSKKRERKGNKLHPDSIGDNNLCKDKIQVDDTNEKCQEPANDKKSDAYAPQSDERKSKRKKRKVKGNEDAASMEKQAIPTKDDIMTMETKESRSSHIMTFSNGLVVEELELGKPDGEVASLGRKVKIHYTGMLKEGGNVYESSIGSNPSKFRLGKGKTIEGVQLGLEGMRVGGRRRLTIPPELGYGSKGNANSVPPNSWLKFDVELLNVR